MTDGAVLAWEVQAGQFGRYIAGEAGDRRRDPGTNIKTSDNLLDDSKRRRVIEGGRELWRNYSVAAWAIRKHLDYVSTFNFQALTPRPRFNERLEALMKWWARPINLDVGSRHSLRRFMRLAEARRVIDGDVFVVKLRDGRVQAIEGDRVRNPDIQRRAMEEEGWVHGLKIGNGGRVEQASIHRRKRHGNYEEERKIQASRFWQLAYWDSFDQYRGVSPLVSSIASFQDSLEARDYALAKQKVTQLFALAITREMADQFEDDDEEASDYKVDFGKGPLMLDLDPGDSASFLESKHPSSEFQSFLTLVLQMALKALDIPWSMYDESYTNFFGSKAALQGYLTSCISKREDLKELLGSMAGWRIAKWVSSGALALPRGWRAQDLEITWVHAGQRGWDTAKEVKGDLEAIDGLLTTRTEIRRTRFGDDWKAVMRKRKEEEEFLQELDLGDTRNSAPEPDTRGDTDEQEA